MSSEINEARTPLRRGPFSAAHRGTHIKNSPLATQRYGSGGAGSSKRSAPLDQPDRDRSKPNRRRRLSRVALNAALWLVCAVPVSHADDGFVKDAASGCAVFKPNLRMGQAVTWKGSCANGNAKGYGVARWIAGDGATTTFEGRFAQGKL